MKELKDYIHLYIGCKVQWIRSDGQLVTQELTLSDASWLRERKDAKLILRPPESITEEEIREVIRYEKLKQEYKTLEYSFDAILKTIFVDYSIESEDGGIFHNDWQLCLLNCHADDFRWALSKGFDLFGLKEAGLAVYETDVKS